MFVPMASTSVFCERSLNMAIAFMYSLALVKEDVSEVLTVTEV